jgi:hypothetical protein
MTEYILKSAGGIIDAAKSVVGGKYSVNIHDNLDLERDADVKAEEVSQAVVRAANSGPVPAQMPNTTQYSSTCYVGPRPTDRCGQPQQIPLGTNCTCMDGQGRPWYGTIGP